MRHKSEFAGEKANALSGLIDARVGLCQDDRETRAPSSSEPPGKWRCKQTVVDGVALRVTSTRNRGVWPLVAPEAQAASMAVAWSPRKACVIVCRVFKSPWLASAPVDAKQCLDNNAELAASRGAICWWSCHDVLVPTAANQAAPPARDQTLV